MTVFGLKTLKKSSKSSFSCLAVLENQNLLISAVHDELILYNPTTFKKIRKMYVGCNVLYITNWTFMSNTVLLVFTADNFCSIFFNFEIYSNERFTQKISNKNSKPIKFESSETFVFILFENNLATIFCKNAFSRKSKINDFILSYMDTKIFLGVEVIDVVITGSYLNTVVRENKSNVFLCKYLINKTNGELTLESKRAQKPNLRIFSTRPFNMKPEKNDEINEKAFFNHQGVVLTHPKFTVQIRNLEFEKMFLDKNEENIYAVSKIGELFKIEVQSKKIFQVANFKNLKDFFLIDEENFFCQTEESEFVFRLNQNTQLEISETVINKENIANYFKKDSLTSSENISIKKVFRESEKLLDPQIFYNFQFLSHKIFYNESFSNPNEQKVKKNKTSKKSSSIRKFWIIENILTIVAFPGFFIIYSENINKRFELELLEFKIIEEKLYFVCEDCVFVTNMVFDSSVKAEILEAGEKILCSVFSENFLLILTSKKLKNYVKKVEFTGTGIVKSKEITENVIGLNILDKTSSKFINQLEETEEVLFELKVYKNKVLILDSELKNVAEFQTKNFNSKYQHKLKIKTGLFYFGNEITYFYDFKTKSTYKLFYRINWMEFRDNKAYFSVGNKIFCATKNFKIETKEKTEKLNKFRKIRSDNQTFSYKTKLFEVKNRTEFIYNKKHKKNFTVAFNFEISGILKFKKNLFVVSGCKIFLFKILERVLVKLQEFCCPIKPDELIINNNIIIDSIKENKEQNGVNLIVRDKFAGFQIVCFDEQKNLLYNSKRYTNFKINSLISLQNGFIFSNKRDFYLIDGLNQHSLPGYKKNNFLLKDTEISIEESKITCHRYLEDIIKLSTNPNIINKHRKEVYFTSDRNSHGKLFEMSIEDYKDLERFNEFAKNLCFYYYDEISRVSSNIVDKKSEILNFDLFSKEVIKYYKEENFADYKRVKKIIRKYILY